MEESVHQRFLNMEIYQSILGKTPKELADYLKEANPGQKIIARNYARMQSKEYQSKFRKTLEGMAVHDSPILNDHPALQDWLK